MILGTTLDLWSTQVTDCARRQWNYFVVLPSELWRKFLGFIFGFILYGTVRIVLITLSHLAQHVIGTISFSWKTGLASLYTALLFVYVVPFVRNEVIPFVLNLVQDRTDCLNEYDITSYATAPNHERTVWKCLEHMPLMYSAEEYDAYIRTVACNSPVTGLMVEQSSEKYDVDARLMLALMKVDSRIGTDRKPDGRPTRAVRTKNPGNVGNDDSGRDKPCETWEEGVELVAKWLSRHRGVTTFP